MKLRHYLVRLIYMEKFSPRKSIKVKNGCFLSTGMHLVRYVIFE